MRRLLTYRDARLLVTGQTLSAFGDWAMWIVMAVWMKSLTGSSARAGLVFFVLGLGSLAGPLGGLLADRMKRRPLMIACDCVLGASVLVLLLVHDRSTSWLIYLVALLYGLAGTIFYPAQGRAPARDAAGGPARRRERRAHDDAPRTPARGAARRRRPLCRVRRRGRRSSRRDHLRRVGVPDVSDARRRDEAGTA